jgi:hypothetical protein
MAVMEEVPIRITLVRPPTGVDFCMQTRGKELVGRTRSTGKDLAFEVIVGVDDGPRFSGPCTHGPAAARFLYVCSGTRAGQADSCWSRRAKIPLTGIPSALVERARKRPSARLEVRIEGTGKDGGPACATVEPLAPGWSLK